MKVTTMSESILSLSNEELLAECDVETYRSSGRGGQHVNTTESAVRLRHRPTGTVATSQQERSQYRNKTVCLQNLRRKLERLMHTDAPRIPTRPSRSSQLRKLQAKTRRSETKQHRGKVRAGSDE